MKIFGNKRRDLESINTSEQVKGAFRYDPAGQSGAFSGNVEFILGVITDTNSQPSHARRYDAVATRDPRITVEIGKPLHRPSTDVDITVGEIGDACMLYLKSDETWGIWVVPIETTAYTECGGGSAGAGGAGFNQQFLLMGS